MEKQPDPRGMRAARRYALWHIGDPYWASQIIRAYLNPETVEAELADERGDSD